MLEGTLSVTTPGLEHVAASELRRKFGAACVTVAPGHVQGKIHFPLVGEGVPTKASLLSLSTAEHLCCTLFSDNVRGILVSEPDVDATSALACIRRAVESVSEKQWESALALWASAYPERAEALSVDDEASWRYRHLNFKVLKKKSGGKKSGFPFTSTELGQAVFHGVQSARPSWTGVLDGEQDVEIMVRVNKSRVFVGIVLCDQPLWRESGRFSEEARNLGPYEAGAVVVDPCCGCGTVGECAAYYAAELKRGIFIISGDFDADAVQIAKNNVDRMKMRSQAAIRPKIDVIRWDASRLPLRTGVADAFVSDLPFGKRCGSRRGNQNLYPLFFAEVSRVLCKQTDEAKEKDTDDAKRNADGKETKSCRSGRAVLLSCDIKNLEVSSTGTFGLKARQMYPLNIGGLNGKVTVLDVDR